MGYLLYGAADSAVAKVGIDLDQEVATHNGGLQLCVALVGGDDGSPPRHLHTITPLVIMESGLRRGWRRGWRRGLRRGFEKWFWEGD